MFLDRLLLFKEMKIGHVIRWGASDQILVVGWFTNLLGEWCDEMIRKLNETEWAYHCFWLELIVEGATGSVVGSCFVYLMRHY